MMYSKHFVCVVRVNGRILREFNNDSSESSVLLPFGTEYSILAKNLESRPARLKVWIDGEDVLSGNGIIIPAGKEHELEGFMNSGGKVTNKFRFIQKTEQIVDHRGDRIDDGIVKIEWQYERPKPVKIDVYESHYHNDLYWYRPKPYWPCNPWPSSWITYTSGTITTQGLFGDEVVSNYAKFCRNSVSSENVVLSNADATITTPAPDEGITVKGQSIEQQYRSGYIGSLEPNKHVMIIRLKGTSVVAGERIVAPVETKTKIQCPTCGVMAKSGTKYCSNCGACVVAI